MRAAPFTSAREGARRCLSQPWARVWLALRLISWAARRGRASGCCWLRLAFERQPNEARTAARSRDAGVSPRLAALSSASVAH